MRLTCLLVLVAVAVSGCTASSDPKPSRDLAGAHVSVLGLWSGPEFESFDVVRSAWEKDTGAVVDWDGVQDLPRVLDSRLGTAKEPDIVVLPSLGTMRELADEGKLLPLDPVVDDVEKDYSPAWRELGSRDGRLYGIFYKVTNKATVWYNPKAFAAAKYDTPRTWQETIRLADTMVADGRTPFSLIAASRPANGWALTDWISEIVLNNCGPSRYDRWIGRASCRERVSTIV